MDKIINSSNEYKCFCSNIAQINHELTQSLLIIHSYIKGCTERIKEDNLDAAQLNSVFEKINKHIELMSSKIHSMS